MKPPAISYYKGTKGRYAGRKIIELFFQVREDSSIKVVDLTRKKIYFNRTFGSIPSTITKSTKREFEKELTIVINN